MRGQECAEKGLSGGLDLSLAEELLQIDDIDFVALRKKVRAVDSLGSPSALARTKRDRASLR
jgi:hypothetical protein